MQVHHRPWPWVGSPPPAHRRLTVRSSRQLPGSRRHENAVTQHAAHPAGPQNQRRQQGGPRQHLLSNLGPPSGSPTCASVPARTQPAPSLHTQKAEEQSQRVLGLFPAWLASTAQGSPPGRLARNVGGPCCGNTARRHGNGTAASPEPPWPGGRGPQTLLQGGILPSCPVDNEWPQIPRTIPIDRVTGNKEKGKATAGFGSAFA